MLGLKNAVIWKRLLKKAKRRLNDDGEVEMVVSQPDPSLRSQLRERRDLLDSVRVESYLEACRKAPYASEGTKKKWRKALGLG